MVILDKRAAVEEGGFGPLQLVWPQTSQGLEEVFSASCCPTFAFNTDPFLGGAREPSQAKVGVHSGTFHVHGVHLHVVIKGELLARPDGSCGKESDAG